jgi:hypothetical protein
MTTTKRTARDEILAAAEEHGWTARWGGRRDNTAEMTKDDRGMIRADFADGTLLYASIGGYKVLRNKRAVVLAELAR